MRLRRQFEHTLADKSLEHLTHRDCADVQVLAQCADIDPLARPRVTPQHLLLDERIGAVEGRRSETARSVAGRVMAKIPSAALRFAALFDSAASERIGKTAPAGAHKIVAVDTKQDPGP